MKIVAAALLLAAAGPLWLDAPVPANWNVAGALPPAASGPRDAELAARRSLCDAGAPTGIDA